jgi:hypothetical protein
MAGEGLSYRLIGRNLGMSKNTVHHGPAFPDAAAISPYVPAGIMCCCLSQSFQCDATVFFRLPPIMVPA